MPLEAVLRGIDEAFEKWRSRKVKTRRVNSLAYCAQAVMEAAKRLSGAGGTRARQAAESGFQASEIAEYLSGTADQLASHQTEAYRSIASTLRALATEAESNTQSLEDLETKLTALEEKMVAIARTETADEVLFESGASLKLSWPPTAAR